MTDLTYFDGEYYDGKYHAVVKQSGAAFTFDYIEDEYFAEGYFVDTDPALATVTADAISYRGKWVDTNRPIDWDATNAGTYSFDSTTKKHGTHSLKINSQTGTTTYYVQSDPLFKTTVDSDEIDSWVFEMWLYYDEDDADNNTFASFGTTRHIGNNSTLGSDQRFLIQENNGRLFVTAEKYDNWPSGKGSVLLYDSSSTQMTAGNWYHISLVYDADLNQYRTYIGSTLQDTVNLGSSTGMTANSQDRLFLIEDNFSDFDRYYDSLAFKYGTTTKDSTGPEFTNTENHLVLAKFDNNFDDDLALTLSGTATLNSSTSITSSGDVLIGAIVQLDSSASITASGVVTQSASAVLASTATVSATATQTVPFDATVGSTASITAQGNRIADADSSMDSNISVSVTGVKTVDVTATISGLATTVTVAGKTSGNSAEFDAVFTLEADGATTVDGAATLSTTVSTTTDNTRLRITESTLAANAAIAETVNRIRLTDAQLDAALNQTADGNVLGATRADLSSAFNSSITGSKTTDTDSTLDVIGSLTSTGSITVDATATFASAINITNIRGLVVNLDQISYTIPAESRTHTVTFESRTHSVAQEQRLYSVPVEQRTHSIAQENRTASVEGAT